MSDWERPLENSLPSLVHGITHSDGIELDLRYTADQELILHHDPKVSVKKQLIGNANPYVESWQSDELRDFGFCSLRDVLDNKEIRNNWLDEGKMVCLELKRPHPNSPHGGGFFPGEKITLLLANMLSHATDILHEYGVPKSNVVFYAFHNKMHQSIKNSHCDYKWAELLPVVPRFGHRKLQRVMAYPQYVVTPFAKLINKHKSRGAAMVPCAIEYFQPFYNRLLLGRSVGLSGRRLRYFQQCQTGMPVYVWPAKERYEYHLLNSGITGLTDNLDPSFTWYQNGKPRWRFPATQPLDESQLTTLNNASIDNHLDILNEFASEVPTWRECSNSRKSAIISQWQKRFNWIKNPTQNRHDDAAPPWQAVRLIGHRGAGKSPRPILR